MLKCEILTIHSCGTLNVIESERLSTTKKLSSRLQIYDHSVNNCCVYIYIKLLLLNYFFLLNYILFYIYMSIFVDFVDAHV